MNTFLSQFAQKHAKLGLSRTSVLPVDQLVNNKHPVAAYYTLAVATVSKLAIPSEKNLSRYPIPVALLARLAIDVNYQNQGLGAKTLITALRHTVRLCDEGLSVHGLVLDVLNNAALSFYQRFDFFFPFTDDPMRLFVPMGALRNI